ncbi:nucleoside 2-deoxyribosyltransferase [Lentibacillus sediminis]|uniref:nucleoside 2-deoxyribosyltransferase n=1 Tax=Lentibacillus sediminis TaxID=1940529 RepID=UPI000C1B866D|nr:nucleoside 2-deoxyribosyltransferase [Lentibacillus sediminis]
MKFYIASSFSNIAVVREVSEWLKNNGWNQTYDWTQNGKASSIPMLREIGEKERNAVKEADIVVIMLPAGKGSHVELGLALGFGKRVFLYSPDERINDFALTATFYHLPEVEKFVGTINDFVEKLLSAK